MIVHIITYGSEVWISDFKSNFDTLDKIQFEKTQNMILKKHSWCSWQVFQFSNKM
jgi:hypothetical protein